MERSLERPRHRVGKASQLQRKADGGVDAWHFEPAESALPPSRRGEAEGARLSFGAGAGEGSRPKRPRAQEHAGMRHRTTPDDPAIFPFGEDECRMWPCAIFMGGQHWNEYVVACQRKWALLLYDRELKWVAISPARQHLTDISPSSQGHTAQRKS